MRFFVVGSLIVLACAGVTFGARADHVPARSSDSPEGAGSTKPRIAFVRDFPRSRKNFIFTVRTDGSGAKKLTHDGSAWSPSWSPDGRRIAFESKRDGDVEIFLMDRDGENVIQLTHNDASDGSPSWSPDGEWIAFASDAESPFEGIFDIYKMRSDGTEVTRLTTMEGQEWTPTWSPDGNRIAFAGDDRVAVMNSDGTEVVEISGDRLAQNPDWAPDGTMLAFQADHFHTGASEIHLMEPDGTGDRRITRRAGPDQSPTWAPDGSRLAFSKDWELAVMRVDGTRQRTIFGGRGEVYAPDWGPSVTG